MLLCSIKIPSLTGRHGYGHGIRLGFSALCPELYLTRKLQRVPWIAAAIRYYNIRALRGALNLEQFYILIKRPLERSVLLLLVCSLLLVCAHVSNVSNYSVHSCPVEAVQRQSSFQTISHTDQLMK